MKNNLPRLDSYVYILTFVEDEPYCITKDRVYMKNKDSFIVEDAIEGGDAILEEYRISYNAEQSFTSSSWFRTFKEVKEALKKWEIWEKEHWGRNVKCKIEKNCYEGSWNVQVE